MSVKNKVVAVVKIPIFRENVEYALEQIGWEKSQRNIKHAYAILQDYLESGKWLKDQESPVLDDDATFEILNCICIKPPRS